MTTRSLYAVLFCLFAAGCARRAPLPGDAVDMDGAVNLEPGRVPVTLSSAPVPNNAIESALFPPELVMANQGAIALTAAQRESIAKDVEKTHADLLKVQWELDASKEKLVTVLGEEHVDETRSKQASADVLRHEAAIKSAHLALLVRIKNTLNKDQQTKLRAVRDGERCGARSDGGGP